jgi:hypothetical protein
MTPGKSPWKYFPDSWKGPRLNCEVGTFPVMASSAEESYIAPAMAIRILTEPGPHDV